MNLINRISRRSFLKGGLVGLGAAAVLPALPVLPRPNTLSLVEFPQAEKLGRVCVGKIDVRAKPSFDSKAVKVLYEDAVLPWIQEVIGDPNLNRGKNRRWVETPEGYIYGPDFQPVQNKLNQTITAMPKGAYGNGMWVEVSVPYVDAPFVAPPAKAESLKQLDRNPRLYYSQIYWVDDLRTRNGTVEYRVTEKHGSPGDMFWVDGRALRIITPEEVAPIHPEVTEKKVLVNISNQTMSCLEGKREVYYCRVSTGAKFNSDGKSVDKWSTPIGLFHAVSRKFIGIHMAGGSAASGYEVFGVGWASFFATGGFSIHSTYWHANFGDPMSHGCVNAWPDDAKFVFLWSAPVVPYDPGKIEISGYDGTKVEVIEI
jgi:lipoprotein-anchoring transpeptidase ErfK/SrfK